VVVPPGATRLYLAVMDGYEWGNNPGSFSVTATVVPAAVSVNPAAGTGSSQMSTFQFSDAAGWQSLGVVNILINSALDARQSCYIAYDVPDNVLYLVPDSGGGLLPGLVLNGLGSTGNTQCAVLGSGSTAQGSGNILTLTLNMLFSSTFAGSKVVYMAARDATANSGWQTMGVRTVPGGAPSFPSPDGMTPSAGTASSTMLTLTYEDATSASNLQTMWALVNTSLDGRSACYIAYYAPANQLLLIPDNGSVLETLGMVLTGKNSVANSQCSISAAGSSVVQNGSKTVLNLKVAFSPSFAGSKVAWMATQTMGGAQTSSWQSLGTWSIPGG